MNRVGNPNIMEPYFRILLQYCHRNRCYKGVEWIEKSEGQPGLISRLEASFEEIGERDQYEKRDPSERLSSEMAHLVMED